MERSEPRGSASPAGPEAEALGIPPFHGRASIVPAPSRRRPKYARIADAILARIEAGHWRPGEQLPAETELARSMDASLGTIQRALQTLAEQGVLVRRHGRGTFVGGERTPANDLRHFRFLSESGDAMLPVFAHMQTIERIEETGPWAAFLGRQPFYVRLDRTLSVDHEFNVASEIYLPGPRFAALLELAPESLNGILIRDFLAARCNAPTLEVEQRLTIEILPPRICTRLEAAKGTIGLVWLLLGRSYRGQPITWQRAWLPPVDRPLQILDHHGKTETERPWRQHEEPA